MKANVIINVILKDGVKHMKIYFAASIRGGRDDVKIYQQLINHLNQNNEVLVKGTRKM
ncbi:hypothetical protein [Furfurilactobacillus cerevisiae]|uniref:hypothetical protein n=1 Tax=Furfurilactobacillus rossiae TaxID=231049 RepID=UPI003B9865FA